MSRWKAADRRAPSLAYALPSRRRTALVSPLASLLLIIALLGAGGPAGAQRSGIELRGSVGGEVAPTTLPAAPVAPPAAAPAAPTGEAPAAGDRSTGDEAVVTLMALITDDGQPIDKGLVWRVFGPDLQRPGRSRLLTTTRLANPQLRLRPGAYTVSVAFGKAHFARRVTVAAGAATTEAFVLNAGGLRLTATLAGGAPTPTGSVVFEVLSDERDQAGNRTPVATGLRPGVVVRLTSGIYHLVSTYGDANAKVRTDVSVEAGKLTEVAARHAAARVTFRLSGRAGGEAIPDTQWTIAPANGTVVRESVGALPTHILAPGSYVVVARSNGRTFRRAFQVKDGDKVQVEVVAQ